MKSTTFQLGWVLTARVACCLSLIAGLSCASKQKPAEVEAPVEVSPVPTTQAPQQTAFEKAQFEQCMDEVANTFSQQKPNLTVRTKECCSMIVATYEMDPKLFMSPLLREDCCNALDWDGSETCTP